MHPILIQIGNLTLYTYGFFVALAVICAFWLGHRRARRLGIDPHRVVDLLFLFFVSGVLGSRLFFVWQNLADYRDDPWRAFSLREGGLVWYGGFLTAALSGILYVSLRRWPLLKLCDFFAPILPLAHAIGRVGCFFNGCCYGRVSPKGFGVVFQAGDAARWPAQLYESVLLVILSFFLWRRSQKTHWEGEIFVFYLLGYSALRFLVEFLRGDQARTAYLTLPQWMSLFLFLGGGFLFWVLRKRVY